MKDANDKQEILNKVVAGMISQGWSRSMVSTSQGHTLCQYRDGVGNKCAVGHLLSDEDYQPRFDYKGVDVYEVNTALKYRWTEETCRFLGELQETHDYGSQIRLAMMQVADRWNLEWPDWLEEDVVVTRGGLI